MNNNHEKDAIELRSMLIQLFVKKDVNYDMPNVIGAIAEVAGEMALATDEADISELDALQLRDASERAVLDVFGATDKDEIINLVGNMGPSYVNNAIGYAVDYRDYSSARANYERQKAEFDTMYKKVLDLSLKEEKDSGIVL